MSYVSLSSIWEGEDNELLERMIPFYHSDNPSIIDCNWGGGRFWKNSKRKVFGCDIDEKLKPHLVCNNKSLPFANSSFDVAIYDPPHLVVPSRNRYAEFGIGTVKVPQGVYTVSPDFQPFLIEGFRILKHNGIVLAKIQDVVNNHRSQWEHINFIRSAENVGFCACDMIVKIRKGPMISPLWNKAHHARKRHVYWIVLRKGKCEK